MKHQMNFETQPIYSGRHTGFLTCPTTFFLVLMDSYIHI